MNLFSQIESILFVASRPLSAKEISKAVQKSYGEMVEMLDNLKLKYNRDDSGIFILQVEDKYQMATNSENKEVVSQFIKNEVSGELTRPQLETLTVVAYRGPLTRPELEQIRGVNCAIILRNLMLRGLVEENEDKSKFLSVYTITFDALAHLGIKSVSELSEYENLNKHEFIEKILENGLPPHPEC